jgi:hypothetical protein
MSDDKTKEPAAEVAELEALDKALEMFPVKIRPLLALIVIAMLAYFQKSLGVITYQLFLRLAT